MILNQVSLHRPYIFLKYSPLANGNLLLLVLQATLALHLPSPGLKTLHRHKIKSHKQNPVAPKDRWQYIHLARKLVHLPEPTFHNCSLAWIQLSSRSWEGLGDRERDKGFQELKLSKSARTSGFTSFRVCFREARGEVGADALSEGTLQNLKNMQGNLI